MDDQTKEKKGFFKKIFGKKQCCCGGITIEEVKSEGPESNCCSDSGKSGAESRNCCPGD